MSIIGIIGVLRAFEAIQRQTSNYVRVLADNGAGELTIVGLIDRVDGIGARERKMLRVAGDPEKSDIISSGEDDIEYECVFGPGGEDRGILLELRSMGAAVERYKLAGAKDVKDLSEVMMALQIPAYAGAFIDPVSDMVRFEWRDAIVTADSFSEVFDLPAFQPHD